MCTQTRTAAGQTSGQAPGEPAGSPGAVVEQGSAAETVAAAEAPPVRCQGDTVTQIVVRPREPFVRGLLDKWQVVSRLVSATHVTTDPDVVRGFLVLREGEPCTELRRAESERILRAQPFLATAVVRPEPDGPGHVRIVVETVDEVTLVAGVRATNESPQLRMLRVGDANLLGEGMYAAAEWRAGTFGRTGYTARFMDYQAFGEPYQFGLEARRNEVGGLWHASVAHPYFTDLQRVAWRVSGGEAHDFLALRQDGSDELALGSRRRYYDVGGLVRIGVPGRLSLFGVSFTGDRVQMDPAPLRFTPDGPVEVPGAAPVLDRYRQTRSARVNALWGVRNISFLPVQSFDALNAVQDARVGFQAGAMLGRSLAVLGSRDDDIFVAADLYAGAGSPNSFLMLSAKGEGRQDYDTNRWDGVLGSARLAWYLRLAPTQTTVSSVEWSGGWRTRVPFQLLLGQPDGGVRGYAHSASSGARRLVARAEHRWFLGHYRESAEYGLAAFVDAGRLWAGDVPFAENTPTMVGAGIGLLAAVPPGSQRLWRLDLAYPLSHDPRGRLEIRISSSNLSRNGWREPVDVRRSREQSMPEGLFSWP
ncbi:MAG TPA: hypothetical protein VFS08_13495 [Gemmatimonadaceae bacterium]|nr:hypothetical protein [Gemmatimonadaceae bacterium]